MEKTFQIILRFCVNFGGIGLRKRSKNYPFVWLPIMQTKFFLYLFSISNKCKYLIFKSPIQSN